METEENAKPRPEGKGKKGKRPAPNQQRPGPGQKRQQKKVRKRERDMKSGSAEEVLAIDIRELRASLNGSEGDGRKGEGEGEGEGEEEGEGKREAVAEELPMPGSEIVVKVVELSSTGDALAVQEGSKQIYVVPFAVPGDILRVKVFRHVQGKDGYGVADFLSVETPSPLRDDSRVRCKYFSQCSGCQFQMLDYAEQLRVKRRVVEKAFASFSELPPELVPAVGDTVGSPLPYGYRTKLTPHFDAPSGNPRRTRSPFTAVPPIGFMFKGRRTTLDIEDCPIGTDAVRAGMKAERARMAVEFGKYQRGATILLRESTKRIPKSDAAALAEIPAGAVTVETDAHVDWKTCVTDNMGTSTEYVGDYVFHNPAGSFFQNNNSILPVVTDYIRQNIIQAPTTTTATTPTTTTITTTPPPTPPIKFLIDAYSGSGLFTITLSTLFSGGSTGIDIAEQSIAFARTNAAANDLPAFAFGGGGGGGGGDGGASFIAADAAKLFADVRYPADETAVVLDPPRKGCDADFLAQLLRFGPRRIVYVSCNVHTQARDVGMLVRGEVGTAVAAAAVADGVEGGEGDKKEQTKEMAMAMAMDNPKGTRYAIESLRGFDFFPQTSHVEGVAVLSRVDPVEATAE
ncbi:putative tRNA (uracil-5-)-methyltransferase protein [Rosellinia necatrix]|uniref:Putative tRNA (Uracil-5-)-methyltransferase protein n=1 Tax=Rosellinia necatrix TaxID=77044 RepID=A0A1W2TK84_ROSNE|nr:putative tRNA (uracil-5-)-methyltransferase protein [Rosellinia necatrix]